MSKTITLSFAEADFLLEAITLWAWDESSGIDGAEVEFGTDDQIQLNHEQIEALFTRIGNAKFSKES